MEPGRIVASRLGLPELFDRQDGEADGDADAPPDMLGDSEADMLGDADSLALMEGEADGGGLVGATVAGDWVAAGVQAAAIAPASARTTNRRLIIEKPRVR